MPGIPAAEGGNRVLRSMKLVQDPMKFGRFKAFRERRRHLGKILRGAMDKAKLFPRADKQLFHGGE